MNVWRWYRGRRWGWQLLIGVIVVPLVLVLGYVAVRSVQYAAADKDAGAYVPSGANVVVRSRGLEKHLERLRESVAWRVIERKILKDPVVRREINALLQESGAPTLDDLDDERKPYAKNLPRGIQAIGADVVATLQVREAVATASYCAIVRLRWLHFLAAPFARFVLPTESAGGETCLVIRDGKQEIRVAFPGGLAIASNSKALLEDALRRRGREEESGRPFEARLNFEKSPGLQQIRKAIKDGGLFPYVKWETARGIAMSADLQDATMVLDATFDGAEPVHSTPPPTAVRSWAPVATSGLAMMNTGGRDLIAWLRSLMVPGSRDAFSDNLRDALQALDDGGLTPKVLPLLQDGMAVITGVGENGGQSVPTLALILPSSDPPAAVDALNGLVKKIAGSWGDTKYFTSEPAGETMVYSWSWPPGLQVAALVNPTYAAVKGMVVVGSNRQFTMDLIRAADQADGFEQTSAYRKLRSRFKELGFAPEPTLAGGLLQPPQLREALTGSLVHVAKFTMPPINGPALRAEVESQLRQPGRPLSDKEIIEAYNAAVDRKVAEEEAALRRALSPLDAFRWGAFEASVHPKGIAFRVAIEFR